MLPSPTPKKNHTRLGLILAIATALSFGTSGALAKGFIDAGWTPGSVVLARIWIAAIALAIPTLIAMRGRWGVLRKAWPIVLLYGTLAVAATQLFYFQAVVTIDVGIALLIEYTAPVAVVIWVWVRSRVRPSGATFIGAAIALLGLAVMLNVFSGVSADPAGVLWAFGAMIGAAAYFILSARQDIGVPPIALAGFGLFVGGTVLGIAGAFGILPLHASTDPVTYAFGSVPFWIPLLALGLVSAAIAYVLGIVSTRMLGSRLASFVALSEVVAAVLYGWLLVGQVPGFMEIIGGALILVGVIIVKLGEREVDALA
ncbi:EamA family transporter [Microbacterium mitrae]|uniref:EamA family transporter n=1 Tax=Microbacterium mitrae TaxID=664640 RepID=A0A5C8HRE5_9MICO|nr:EamA family transporter [Microbacterium mitrae]